jgi:hypothetical protein
LFVFTATGHFQSECFKDEGKALGDFKTSCLWAMGLKAGLT